MSALNRNDSNLLYTQVSNFIREKIYSQEWGAHKRIPSEHELMDILGVSRGTVQKGVEALVHEGLLERRRGKGTFVRRAVVPHPSGNSLLSYAESFQMQGIEFETFVLALEVMPASSPCAEHLGLAEGDPVMFLKRVRTVKDAPVLLMESRLNLDACPGLDKLDYTKRTLFSAIEMTSKHKISWGRERYGARVAGETRGPLLGCDPGDPVLNIDQVIYLDDGTPVEWGEIWLPANSYVMSSILQRDNTSDQFPGNMSK